MSDDITESDECWFLKCSRSPDGILHGNNGFSVAACENHATKAVSFGKWNEFNEFEEVSEA